MKFKGFIFLQLVIVFYLNSPAQHLLSGDEFIKPTSYQAYLQLALKNNLLLMAEKYKVEEAEAAISLARIFPNPEITMGNASGDITRQNLQQQFYEGITQTIVRPNKFKQGIKVAKAQYKLQQILFEDYLRLFKLDLTKRYVNALLAKLAYEKDKKTNELLQGELQKLKIDTNESKVELYRIKIETAQTLAQLYQSEEIYKMAVYDLYLPLSFYHRDTVIGPYGNLHLPLRKFNLDSIVPIALDNRTDVLIAKQQKMLTQEHLNLAKTNRRKDFEIQIGNNSYTRATNLIAPTPPYQAITALFTFQLPFSNLKKQDLRIAELDLKRASFELSQTQTAIQIEIAQSYDRHLTAEQQLSIYSSGLLEMTDKVFEEELEIYKSGKSNFLDLTESQRKRDEIYHNYLDALRTYVFSKMELEDDLGIWDIDF